MNVRLFTFIFWSLMISGTFGLFTSENVVFQKTNEVFINDAHWSVTFVHDLKPFSNLISKIKNDLAHVEEILKAITNFYERSNLTGYVETFKSLHIEADLLTDTYMSVFDSFEEYQTLSVDQNRSQRSILPIIGQLMSSLFGTLSESDLEDINRNVRTLAKNQKQIIHDLDVSLSVLNLTRSQVAENRRSIMDLIEVIQKLDVKILKMQEMFSQRFVRLEQFVHTYLQFQMIFDEIKQTTQDAIFYLDSLKSELNMLSMQHLSTNTISPRNLKELLIEIEMKLPNNFELPRNPRKDIWFFYKTLNCITYLESNEIRITLKIPLMNTKERYEIYKTYNLPVPLSKKNARLLLKYDLETEMLMVSKDRAKFSLLSENTYHLCNSYHYQFCNPETAFYQSNVNQFCIRALFMQNAHDINKFCKQMVVLNQKLPFTRYLSFGLWVIVTEVPLTFTVNCRTNTLPTDDILIEPPFGIVKLNNTCKASNRYLQLPEYFGMRSQFERSDPLQILLRMRNLSQFSLLNNSKVDLIRLEKLELPSHLSGLKQIPLQSLFHETRAFESVDFDYSRNNFNWTIVTVILIASVCFISLIVWLQRYKVKCFNQIVGKRLTNDHDLEIVNVKRSSSYGEDEIEMSAILHDRTVSNRSEGQENPFRRTDAMLAFAGSK